MKPLKPELRGMVGEIAGIAHDFNTMHTVLQQGAKNLQNIERNKISALSLASGYHKLAAAYLTMAMREDAIPLLRMALLVMPTFVPALFELAHVYVDMGDYSQAQRALKNLKEGIEFSATAAKRQSWKREVADLERVISRMGSRDEL